MQLQVFFVCERDVPQILQFFNFVNVNMMIIEKFLIIRRITFEISQLLSQLLFLETLDDRSGLIFDFRIEIHVEWVNGVKGVKWVKGF